MLNKNICMITHDAPFIDRRILLEAMCLIEKGFNVYIIYPFGMAGDDFRNIGINYITINKLYTLGSFISQIKRTLKNNIPNKIYNFLKNIYLNAIPNFIDYENELFEKAIQQKYDIYVAHDLPALPIAYKASKKYGSFLVYDAHEFYTGQITLKGRRKRFFEILEKEYINRVDLMFTVNEDIASLFKKKYGIQNIQVLYNAMEDQSINKHISFHNILGIHQSKKIILYQGGFLENRNLEFLIESVSYFPENFVLVMLGYSFLGDRLKNISRRINILGKKVFFIDRVPQKELLSYTSSADFGIIPYPNIDLNTKYCTPNKLFEFIMAEVPIIANKQLVTVKRILEKYEIGKTITFSSPKKTAKEIEEVIREINLEKVRIKIKKAKDVLSWQRQKKVLLDSYDQMICNGNQ